MIDGVGQWVEHRQIVRGFLQRAIQTAPGIHRRVAPVGGHQVVQIRLGVGPVPLGDDHVALQPVGPLGHRRQFARRDAVGPVGVHLQRALVAHARQRVGHEGACLARAHPLVPGFERVLRAGKQVGDGARGLGAHLMTHHAAAIADAADEIVLMHDAFGDAVAFLPRARELVGRGHFQQRIPVARRIELRCRTRIGCRCGPQVQRHARLGAAPWRIHQAVAAHEDVIGAQRQVGNQEQSVLVSDHRFGIQRRQIPRLGNHPHACLGTVGAVHTAGNVVIVHRGQRRGGGRRGRRGRGRGVAAAGQGQQGKHGDRERQRALGDHGVLDFLIAM